MQENRRLYRFCGIASLALLPTFADAVEQPSPFSFDAGPLGQLEISGGADAYGYALTGAGSDPDKGLLGTSTSAGLEFLNGLVKLQKPDGLIQFTIEAGGVNSLTLGTRPKTVTAQKWSTGPFRAAYVTAAPTSDLTISAGQIGSLEGYEFGDRLAKFQYDDHLIVGCGECSKCWRNSDIHTRALCWFNRLQRRIRYERMELSAASGVVFD